MASEFPKKSPSDDFFIFLLTLGQLVGVFPIEFVDHTGKSMVIFRWASCKTVYTIFHTLLQVWMVFMCIYAAFCTPSGWNFRHIVRTLFYASSLWGTISLLQLVRTWPSLMKKWNRVDKAMELAYGYPKNLKKRCKIATAVTAVYSLGQIMIFVVYNIILSRKLAYKNNIHFGHSNFFKTVYPQIFKYIPYSLWIGILCQINYIFCIARMAYTDLFISLLSSVLSLRFQQITTRLGSALNNKRSLQFWREVREDYDQLATLSKAVDNVISNVVFVSYAANLILLLVYLRNSTIVDELNIQKVYNVWFFGVFVVRILVISLYVAWVNDESKEPAPLLNSVSTTQYNTEIQRFLLQISFNNVAFTGNKMFRVTRTIILHIGGIVLTYELVLVQFSELSI